MEDGLEDLLDELETDNASRPAYKQAPAPATKDFDSILDEALGANDPHTADARPPPVMSGVAADDGDDLENLLGSMSPVDSVSKQPAPRVVKAGGDNYDDLLGSLQLSPKEATSAGYRGVKMDPVVLERDNSNSGNGGRINCLSCDFKVVGFTGYKWAPDVDYLFMRYNYPDFEKLTPKLIASDRHMSYGCGCSWRTMGRLEKLSEAAGTQTDCGDGRWLYNAS